MAEIWANGLPSEGRSPKSGHRMAAEGMQFPWRWYGGTIFPNLDVIWGMSVNCTYNIDASLSCAKQPQPRG